MLCLLAGNQYVKHVSNRRILSGDIQSQLTTIDCIMVLGCGLTADGNPAMMLADQLDKGIELYQAGVSFISGCL